MKFSVVVATYNRREALQNCLQAVFSQSYAPHEVIVVDDGSSDGTAEMVQACFPSTIFASTEKNSGPAVARNNGIALCSGEVVAFTDDDCVPPPDWLAQMADGFAQYPGIVGVSGYQEAGEELLATNAVALADRMMRLSSFGAGADTTQRGGCDAPGFGTNNAAYLRQALLAVGSFDESFRVASGEDTDLKVRICEAAKTWQWTAPGGMLLYLPLKVRHDREYSVRAQVRLGVKRGMGAYHFERSHERAPTIGRIGLRVGIRTVRFLRDLLRYRVSVAVIIYLTRLADCYGQLRMAWMALRKAPDSWPNPGQTRSFV